PISFNYGKLDRNDVLWPAYTRKCLVVAHRCYQHSDGLSEYSRIGYADNGAHGAKGLSLYFGYPCLLDIDLTLGLACTLAIGAQASFMEKDSAPAELFLYIRRCGTGV